MTSVPVVLSPEPFSRETVYVDAPAGTTVRATLIEAVRAGQINIDDLSRTTLYVDGERIDRAIALDLVLAQGQVVNLVVEPLGGGGSGGGKDIGQLLLTIAVIAVSAWVGGAPMVAAKLGSQMAARIAGAAIMAVGQAAIGAIYAPDNKGMAKANDTYALQTASNQYRPWAPFPMALGEVIAAPDLVAKTFTQSQGDEQWIYGILGVHYGACETSEEKIGDTLISTMGAGDVRIVKHLTPGPRTFTIYPNDVDQLDLSETFEEGVEIIRAGSAEGQRFDLDIYFPSGLYWRDSKGRFKTEQNDIQASWRPIDQNGVATGGWTSPVTWTFRSASNDPIRQTKSVNLPLGRYEFRLKKLVKPNDPDNVRVDAMYWTAIKAVAFRKPVADETLSIIEFAVRATALNQGSLAAITCRIKPLVPTWTGAAWSAPVASSNPAALVRWLLTGPAPARPLLTSQADTRLRAWASLCDTYGWTANIYLTDDRKQDIVLGMLGLAGRASLFWDGTQIAASPWVEKPAPRQLFGGDNLRDHKWSITYAEEVHALRVEFQNIDKRGEADEVYVYADGYAETAGPGVQAASLIEALRLEGQRTLNRAYRDGRWELGSRKHQRRVDTWSTDIENIASALGDRVRLAYSRVDGGQSMRVRCRRWAGGLVSGLRLAEPVEMEAGKDYAVDLRLPSGLYTSVPIVTAPGQTREIQFQSARQPEITPSAGDKVAFGVPTRISEDVEIIGIEPGENLTASLVGSRYVAPLLMAGETGPIPPLTSALTGDRQKDPPAPSLLGVQVSSDGIRVGFSMPPWRGSPLTGYSVRWRSRAESGEVSTWTPLPSLPADAMILTTPPLREAPVDLSGVEATRVEIEISANTADGRRSTALVVKATQPVVATPLEDDWSITASGPNSDGAQLPAFDIVGHVTASRAARVLVEFGPSEIGPWQQAFNGAPVEGMIKTEAVLAQAGILCWFAITYWSFSGIPSGQFILGPYAAPGLIAGDVSPTAPTILALDAAIEDVFGNVSDVSDDLEAAVDVLAAQGAEIATARGGQPSLGARIVQVNQSRIDGDSTNAAATSLVSTEVATARQGQPTLSARVTQLNQARIDGDAANATVIAQQGQEIEAARGGQPNLNARIVGVNQARIDGDTASATAITNLTARTGEAEADILAVDSALATETGARASAVQQLTAQVDPIALNTNSTFANYPNATGLPPNLVASDTPAAVYGRMPGKVSPYAARIDTTGSVNNQGFRWSWEAANWRSTLPERIGGDYWVLEYKVDASNGRINGSGFQVELVKADGSGAGGASYAVGLRSLTGGDVPSGTILEGQHFFRCDRNQSNVRANLWFWGAKNDFPVFNGVSPGGITTPSRLYVHRVALRPATEAEIQARVALPALSATVTQQNLAIIDLETGQALAKFELIAAATGGKPARFRLISSSLGSAIALDAPFIYWGDNTVFDDASDTLQTTVGGRIRIMALGAPFGASGNLLEWWGPTGIALGAMTTTNGDNGRMTTAPYVFDNVVSSSASKSGLILFSGSIGRNATTNTAGTTTAITVPSTGKFQIEVANVEVISAENGTSSVEANGSIRLQIGKGGVYSDVGPLLTVKAPNASGAMVNAASLNFEVAHAHAGSVTFRMIANGAGPSFSSDGGVSGTLKATWYPA